MAPIPEDLKKKLKEVEERPWKKRFLEIQERETQRYEHKITRNDLATIEYAPPVEIHDYGDVVPTHYGLSILPLKKDQIESLLNGKLICIEIEGEYELVIGCGIEANESDVDAERLGTEDENEIV